MVWSYPVPVIFGPFVLAYLVLCEHELRGTPWLCGILTSLQWVFTGVLGITAVLCVANALMGGSFLFFMPTVQAAISKATGDRMALPLSQWIYEAHWLVLPMFTVTNTLMVLATSYG